ncbi:MAG: YHS domain-containing protein [Deltaproteobacteria bacterium]|nr:YHS domain-containing protein [Deltaproteobacteria bacterium]
MTTLSQNDRYIDPVCHMKVDKKSTVPPFDFEGDTYYFCAEGCRQAFMAAPGKYLGVKPAKKKGVWGRYLNRLNKATGGKPPSCCH